MPTRTDAPAIAGRGEPLGLPVLSGHQCPECSAIGSRPTHGRQCSQWRPAQGLCPGCGRTLRLSATVFPIHMHVLGGQCPGSGQQVAA